MDGSSQEDEDLKSDMDKYKTKSIKWTDRSNRTRILKSNMDKLTKWTDHPKGENNLQSPQSGQITLRVKIIYIVHKVDGPPKVRIINKIHKVDGSPK